MAASVDESQSDADSELKRGADTSDDPIDNAKRPRANTLMGAEGAEDFFR